MACCYPHTHMQSLAGWAMRVHHTHTHTQYAARVNSAGLKGRGVGLRGDQCPGVPLQLSAAAASPKYTHTHTPTHTQAHTETHHPDLNSLLISPYRTIKVPPCSGTWSPTVGKRGRQVQEEKDQFDILFSLSLSLSIVCARLIFLLSFI